MDKVLGIGNALVDIMTKLPDDLILEKFLLKKGSMQLSDREFAEKINQATSKFEKSQSSGGSAANAIHGLANLGAATGYIGKVGNDEFGEFFSSDMRENKIEPIMLKSKTDTGRAIALVSPDSERTFATYLGAAVELSENDLNAEQFKGYQYLHIEGYLVQNHALMNKAARLAKANNMKISIDMASYNVVNENIDFFKKYVKDYVDIIFANEEESKAFTGKSPEEALNELAEYCEIAVVKIGKKGSLVKNNGKTYIIEPFKANSIDTTGAGDLYASGFLYGLVNNMPMDKCGRIGSLCASKVIEVIGSKMKPETWDYIKKNI
ncbi:MAG: sugar kinase [Bacteroidetes bacterium GWC2_33_15]|nr:MAG: sugar kinase [Bacteroidetes bacterium GWA2_33_15]OFX51125.1 MAG: sugar kinase [Bacteroidetes bacterium GWC2_33_15]OFX66442.1 MAG: sugar kinase [Bacteroidetes bacterium GWB2_32_14]OFX70333.1 MAG: sugar kinase [Bacteroidetes bacterium GWD2_33_33]HAN17335.1 adenosine kinase [Bacteroidales bacterium]